jgi:subtilisin family serine protease
MRKNLLSMLLALVLIAGLVVPSAGAVPSGGEMVDVLIGFDRQPGGAERALVEGVGGKVKHSYTLVPAVAARLPAAALPGLQKNPRVTVIEPDGQVEAIDYASELNNTWGVKRIQAGDVHQTGNLGTGVKLAVIDTGIDYAHPELTPRYAGGYDFVNNDNDPKDDNGHGTHVAGTAAALRNGAGVVGAAPEAALYGLKVLDSGGSGSWSDIIAALQWAGNHGVQITNNSYGSSGNPGTLVKAAFDNTYAGGMLHIAAAGNNGNPPGNKESVIYPAKWDSVVAVAATNQDDQRASWSSTGPELELAAPGVGIRSTWLNGGYRDASGTSMASPHVAGTAALVISAGITDTNGNGRINDEVRQVLNDTAEDLGSAGRDNQYGFGLVNAAAAVGVLTPPAPAVKVALSTDKSAYVTGEDTAAVLTAVVKDENNAAIGGLGSSAFATLLDGGSAAVTFSETGAAGTYTGSLDISALADGTHEVEVTVTDARSISGSGSATFTTGPAPTEPTIAIVDSITYVAKGGANKDRHLDVWVAVVDDQGNPLANAAVSITLFHDSGTSWNFSGTTGSGGTVTFGLKNIPTGCYNTVVNQVTANGLTWDGVTPPNEFCK